MRKTGILSNLCKVAGLPVWRLHQHLQHVQRASTLNPTTDFNKRKRRNVCPEWKKITAEYFGEITAYMVICTVEKALEHRNPNLICRAKPPYWKMQTGSGVVSVDEGSYSNYYVFCEPLIPEKLMEALDRASHWSRGTLTADKMHKRSSVHSCPI